MARQPEFSSPETEEVAGYRRINGFAVFALLFGLLSALALIHPLAWVVPIIALALALAALRSLAANPEMAGRTMAVAGLILALLFGSWGATWTLGRQIMLNRQARRHAEHWFDLLHKKDYPRAHQLTLSYFERIPPGESLEEFYQVREVDFDRPDDITDAAHLQLESFLTTEPVKTLVNADDFQVSFARNSAIQRENQYTTVVEQVFRAQYRQDNEPRELVLRVRMRRNLAEDKAYWELGRLSELGIQ